MIHQGDVYAASHGGIFAATDLRHVRWVRETLRSGRFRRALEVGCLHGYTSSALLAAAASGEVEAVHLCDPAVTPELTRTVAHYGVAAAIHRETSAALFARGTPYDLVFLDGDHTEPTVRAEAAVLMESPNEQVSSSMERG